MEFEDYYEDGFCLLCGEPAKEHYQSDSRQTWYSCNCALQKKYEEAQRTVHTMEKIANKRAQEMRTIAGYYREIKGLKRLEKAIANIDDDKILEFYKNKYKHKE